MLRFTTAAIITALAVAQAPAKPTWPSDFTSFVEEVDLNRRESRFYMDSYSVTNNAEMQEERDRFNTSQHVIEFEDYKTGRDYLIFPTRCMSRATDGTIFVPPVSTFTYNGTEAAHTPPGHWDVPTYRWIGDMGPQKSAFVFHTTQDTAETPVGWFDYTRAIQVKYFNFTIVSTWPAGYWNPPASCNNGTRANHLGAPKLRGH